MHFSNRRNLYEKKGDALSDSAQKGSASTSRPKRQKFVCEEGYVDARDVYRAHIQSVRDQEKESRRALRSNASQQREARNKANRSRGVDVIDWNTLDEVETVTFDPRTDKHAMQVELLGRDARSLKRKQLLVRLETEFCRLYTRYRRAAERAKGTTHAGYAVMDGERKYAQRAAVTCVMKRVTPRQALEYWHANIGSFARKGMTVPSLAFMSSPANIDTVACSIVPDKTAASGGRVRLAEEKTKPRAGNSFSDASGLDIRLRAGLEQAGYDTTDLNDRYLVTVQRNAMGLAQGREIFMGRGPIRDMSKWAAENLYAD